MTPWFRIRTTQKTLPGLKKAVTILHISDIHAICHTGAAGSEQLRQADDQEAAWKRLRYDFAEQFGEPLTPMSALPTAACLEKVIELAAQMQPDAVVLTGDTLDYVNAETVAWLRTVLEQLPVPYLLVHGNHDRPHEALSSLYGSNVLSRLELDGVVLCAMDNSGGHFTVQQVCELEHSLQSGVAHIAAYHMPVETPDNREALRRFDEYFVVRAQDAATQAMRRLLTEDSRLCCALCGHLHGEQLLESINGCPQYVASSAMIGYAHRLILLPAEKGGI